MLCFLLKPNVFILINIWVQCMRESEYWLYVLLNELCDSYTAQGFPDLILVYSCSAHCHVIIPYYCAMHSRTLNCALQSTPNVPNSLNRK